MLHLFAILPVPGYPENIASIDFDTASISIHIFVYQPLELVMVIGLSGNLR